MTKPRIRTLPALILLLIIALGTGAIIITKVHHGSKADALPRQLVEQYLRALENCDFKQYITAKQQAVYRTVPWDSSLDSGSAKDDFTKTCGQLSSIKYLREKSTERDDQQLITFYYQIQYSVTGEPVRQGIIAPFIVGNSHDGYTIFDSPSIMTETQYRTLKN